MTEDEIKNEIEKVQKQLQELKEQLNKKSLSDPDAQKKIAAAAKDYRAALNGAGLNDISNAFGEVAAIGKYAIRGIFLTNNFKERKWEWCVFLDQSTNSEVLVRIDKSDESFID
jgi:uncharacterized protein YpuA (DUF1002 family)